MTGKFKDLEDMHSAWKALLTRIGPHGREFAIFSRTRGAQEKYFHARVRGQHIVVGRARTHAETANISGERTIDFAQFCCVAKRYLQYVWEEGHSPHYKG